MRRLTTSILVLWLGAAARPMLAGGATERQGPSGVWEDTAAWSASVPDAFTEASLHGAGTVNLSRGNWSASRVEVGTQPGDRSTLVIGGGSLTIAQDSLIVGEYSGGEGWVRLTDGALYSRMDLFVGGASASARRMNRSRLTVEGGILEGLSFTVGEGLGSRTRLEIVGSRPRAIEALEFVYLLAAADPGGRPGDATLAFTLDAHGVTPITIPSRWDGLRIEHDAVSRCHLEIALSAVPPREDITLVHSGVPIRGEFDSLPESAQIQAAWKGRTYRWILTYRGGSGGHDLVLLNRSEYLPGDPITHVRPLPDSPELPWIGHPLRPLSLPPGIPAFPGAEGYGAYAEGGRGGRVIPVTILADAGPGSLRAALEDSGPRCVQFWVGGVIELKSPIVIRNPFVTVDGSDGPAPGITLVRHGLEVRAHDVVLRQFRVRIGDQDVRRNDRNISYAAGDGEYAVYFIEGSENCIADHLSLSWSTNKILSTTKGSDRVTVQWCILSESLNLDGHGYASIASGDRVSWHHNLFAHNFSRNPRFQGAVDADFRNNVIYDWGEESTYGEFDRLNFVGNYFKPGPSRTVHQLFFHSGKEAVPPGSLYLAGNVMEGDRKISGDNWRGTRFYYDRTTLAAPGPFAAPLLTPESAAAAYADVLAHAGATAPERDAVDRRVVQEVRSGTGRIIDSVPR